MTSLSRKSPALIVAGLMAFDLAAAPLVSAADAKPSQAIVSEFVQALGAKDIAKVRAMLAPDATVMLPFGSGEGTTAKSRTFEGVEQAMGYFGSADQRLATVGFADVEISLAGDDRVFVEATGDMTLPDGRAYRNRYVIRFDIADGRITEVREYFDPLVAGAAFGN